MFLQKSSTHFDVIICGAGPSGLALSCYLARSGFKVAVLEQAVFPRHQIGESLLPFSNQIFDEIGFKAILDQASFVRKYAACFHSEDTKTEKVFKFANSLNPLYESIYHVPRDNFDSLFLNYAKKIGVNVYQPYKFQSIQKSSDKVIINNELSANLFVRANGTVNSTFNPENYVENLPDDNKTAIYSYFKYDLLSHQERNLNNDKYSKNDILINLFYEDNFLCWAWAIPISEDIMSVGFVVPSLLYAKFNASNLSKKQIGEYLLQKNSRVIELISKIEPEESYRIKFNFQRVSKKIVFDREISIGDAAGFIDPVFSSGIHLGLNSAKLAFEMIKILDKNSNYSTAEMQSYEDNYRSLFWIYYKFVKTFYQKNIVENFFLKVSPDLVDAEISKCFTSILSGDVRTQNKIVDSLDHRRLNINPKVLSIFLQN